MSVIVPRVVVKSFYEGEDPGFVMLRLVGADTSLLTAATSWSLKVFDLAQPSTDITTGQPGTFSGAVFTTNPLLSATLLVDGFWSGIDDIGYNFRHYVKAADFNAPALLGGHSYRFEYYVVTPAYDGTTANAWGTLCGVREGTCLELRDKAEPIMAEKVARQAAREAVKEALKAKDGRNDPGRADHLAQYRWKKGESGCPGGVKLAGTGKKFKHKWSRVSRAVKQALKHDVAERIADALVSAAQDQNHAAFIQAVDRVHDYSEGKLVAKAEVKGTVHVARMAVVGLTEEEAARVALDFGTVQELTNGHSDEAGSG